MIMNESMEKINNQLEKVRDFRYFLFLACLLFFLDFSLIIFYDTPIISFNSKTFLEKSNIGDVLIFFTLFAFFLSFVVPGIKYLLISIAVLLPGWFIDLFRSNERRKIDPKDYFYISDLKYYAVSSGCSTAQNYLMQLEARAKQDAQLEFLSLALLISIGLNLYAYSLNSYAICGYLVKVFDQNTLVNGILVLILSIFFMACAYLGILKDIFTNSDDRIYFPNHPFKKSQSDDQKLG